MKIFYKITTLVTLMFFLPLTIFSYLIFNQYRLKIHDGFVNDTLAAAKQCEFELRTKLASLNDLTSPLMANGTFLFNLLSDDVNPPNFYQLSRDFHQMVYNSIPSSVRAYIYRITYFLIDEIQTDGNLLSNISEACKDGWYSPNMLRRNTIFLAQHFVNSQWIYTFTQPMVGVAASDLLKIKGFIKTEVRLDYFTQYLLNDRMINNFAIISHGIVANAKNLPDEKTFDRYERFIKTYPEHLDWNIQGDQILIHLATLGGEIPIVLEYSYSQDAWLWTLGLQFIGFIFTLVIALFCTFLYICYKYSMRIDALVYKMKLVKDGSLTMPEPIAGNDEIAMLDRFFIEMVVQLKQLIEQNLLRKLRENEAQLNALQAQINPHFFYNTMQVIDALALKGDVRHISMTSQKLAEIFRYNMDRHGGWFVVLREELKHVKNYIYIQRLRFGDRVQVFFDVQDGLMEVPVLKFMLQPLVENCFRHAFANSMDQGEIEISVYNKEFDLYLRVTDNGEGITPKERLDTLISALKSPQDDFVHINGSIGLLNVSRRLALAYSERYEFTIHSPVNQGLQVIIRIPMERTYHDENPDS